MKIVKARNVKKKHRPQTTAWAGLNQSDLIADNQFSSTTNMSTRNFPYPSPRLPREILYTLTSGKALFSSPDYLAWVDALTFASATNDITFGTTTITSAASAFSGIAVGDTLTITGCTVNTENNTTCIVTTATAGTITCSASTFTITNGTPSGRETAAITFTGCSFKYNNITEGVVTSSSKSMVDFNGKIGIFPDKKTYDYIDDDFAVMVGKLNLVKYGYDASGDIDYDATTKIRNKTLISISPNTSYTLVNDKSYTVASVCYLDVNGVFISKVAVNFSAFTSHASAYYMNVDITGTNLTCAVSITNAVYPTKTAIPDIDYACTCENRVWGFYGDNIYVCKQGNINDWTTMNSPSVNTDAWTVDTGTGGDFTGCAAYRKTVYAFKTDLMLRLYGDIASNFQYQTVTNIGCIDNKSIRKVNNTLYFLGKQGVYEYQAGVPSLISQSLNETYVSGIAGGDDRYYYLCLYNGSKYNLYVFDTQNRVWVREDTLQVKESVFLDGYIYALTATKIYKFNSGNEIVTMTLLSKEWTEQSFDKKNTNEVYVRTDLDVGTRLSVSKRIDNGEFSSIETNYTKSDKNPLRIHVLANNADHLQLKLEMIGDGKILDLGRTVLVGGKY